MLHKCKSGIRALGIIISSVLLLACNGEFAQHAYDKTLKQYLADSIDLPENISTSAYHSIVKYCDSGRLAFFDKEQQFFFLYDIASDQFVDSIAFSSDDISSLTIHNFDTIYVADNQHIYAIFNGIIRRYDLSGILKKFVDPDVWISDGTEMACFRDTVKFSVRWFSENDDSVPSRKSVQSHYDVLIKVCRDSVQFLGKYNPDPIVLVGQDYGTNMVRHELLLDGHTLVSSFAFWDTVYHFDFSKKSEHKTITPSSVKPQLKPFDYHRGADHGYFLDYQNSNAWFTFFYADSWRGLVYQFLKHPAEYITAEGEKRAFYDAPFSLLVFDKQMNMLQELLIGPKSLYPLRSFVTPAGLYIAADKDSHPVPGRVRYYRFVITDGAKGAGAAL